MTGLTPDMAMALFWIGLVLIGGEILFLSFGALGMLGICLVLLAGIILETHTAINLLPDDSILKPAFIAVLAVAILTLGRFAMGMAHRLTGQKEKDMVGAHGKIMDWNGIHGHIYFEGQEWHARAHH